jgi:hypothetical protein
MRAGRSSVAEPSLTRRHVAPGHPNCHAGLWLQEPYRHRPAARADPPLDGHGCCPTRQRSFPTLLDPENTASRIWADTAYRTGRNLKVLERRGLSERIQFRRPPRRGLSEQQAKANAVRARIRSSIEHVFAAQKHRMALFARAIGLARAQVKIGMANLTYNFTRLAWLST